MKNIMVVAHDDSGQEARLQCALDVVRAVGGHLNCLSVIRLLAVLGELGSGQAQQVVYDEAVKIAEANRAKVEARLVAEGLPYSWADLVGGLLESVRDQARLNDLVVVSSHGQGGETAHVDIAKQIVGMVGRPVLAVPHRTPSLDLFGTALVAWDGSAPAEAALRAAVPLLGFARRVVIVSVGENKARSGLEEAAAYCSRHGLSVEAAIVTGQEKVYRTILDEAQKIDAKWIVMGAYGHGKLREDLFGGVTRAMIEHGTVPLFLAK